MFASNVTQMIVISGGNGLYGSMGPRGHVRHLALGDRGHAKCALGPKHRLEGVLFGLKSHVGGRFDGTFLASNATQVNEFSGWNGLHGSMRPRGHVRHLSLVMGAMKGAHWVRKDRLRLSFLA